MQSATRWLRPMRSLPFVDGDDGDCGRSQPVCGRNVSGSSAGARVGAPKKTRALPSLSMLTLRMEARQPDPVDCRLSVASLLSDKSLRALSL